MYTTRLPILERVHNLISNYCRENACCYIDNRNIGGFCLYKDGFPLLEGRKKILANNFIVNLNNFFRYEHTPSTNIFMNDSDLRVTSSLAKDLQVLHHERLKHSKNPMIGDLNKNSLRNKLTDLKVILKYLSLDCFILSETKLDESFPNAQFTLEGYEIRARRDTNKFGRGLIEYVRKGLICKRTAKYEPKSNECINSEITFAKKKWVIFSIYRPQMRKI